MPGKRSTSTARKTSGKTARSAGRSSSAAPTTRQDAYERVTEAILAQLAAGVVPWRKTWNSYRTEGRNGVITSGPRNAISGRPYRGINALLLAMQPYQDPRWLTFNQARAAGGSVRKGEK